MRLQIIKTMMAAAPTPSASLPRKGSGAKGVLFTILLMYTILLIEIGQNLVSHFTTQLSMSYSTTMTISSSSMPQKRTDNSPKLRRVLSESSYRTNSNITNDFIRRFKDTLYNNDNNNATLKDTSSNNNFAALILKDNKVYCRQSQIQTFSRARYFVQMLQEGLDRKQQQDDDINKGILLPILIKHDDSNGCYPKTLHDKYNYPRLTWSIPADTSTTSSNVSSNNNSWCQAIGMPSYKMWRDVSNKNNHISKHKKYSWDSKINKAIWRGSTTANKAMYGHLPLNEIPRSKLVQLSLLTDKDDDNNDGRYLIDAGYHKVVGKYHLDDKGSGRRNSKDDGQVNDSSSSGIDGRMLKEAIPLEEMSKYKAIIDIDGNNWSARFHTLLCSNSVVIKIQPDFIESFYNEVKPNVHYMSASLTNLTQVLRHVLDDKYELQMKHIVDNANGWCQSTNNVNSLTQRALNAVSEYQSALDQYHLLRAGGDILSDAVDLDMIDDMIECKL